MHRRRLTRALVALAVPALTVPALATSATAAATAPAVPSVAAVAKIYPHFDGGSSSESVVSKIRSVGKDCKPGKVIRGAKGRSASYLPADPADYAMTGAEPGVFTTAMRFRSARDAVKYLHASATSTENCPTTGSGGDDVDAKITRIKFRLGDERQGYKIQITQDDTTLIMDSLLVRDGRYIVTAGVMSTDGQAPAVKKAIQLMKVAVDTAT
jgi:hypothetical protein